MELYPLTSEYLAPQIEVLESHTEGVLCFSEQITTENPFANDTEIEW